MSAVERDLAFVRASLADLESFLRSDEIFWPLGGDLPRLTIGGLLLAERRLGAGPLFGAEQAEWSRLEAGLAASRAAWPAAWEGKSAKESVSRLRLWKNFLDDYADSPADHRSEFRHAVEWRAMLALLGADLTVLDEMLWDVFVPGGFLWEPGLMPAFPEDEFWFLYGNVR
jgi:hypothetical protein